MSWSEQVKTNLIIITGDGKTYSPIYNIEPRSYDFHVAVFDFPNIAGSLANRKKKMGTKHDLEFYFQGDTHIDDAFNFEQSANDERPWKIYHPIHGNLLAQPLNLNFDATGYNLTKISCEIIETISQEYPKITIDPKDKSNFDIQTVNETNAASFANRVTPSATDLNQMKKDSYQVYLDGLNSVKSPDQVNEYLALYNEAKTTLTNITSTIAKAQSTINLLTYPAVFEQNLKTKLQLLQSQFSKLTLGKTPSSKTIYELNGSAIVTAMVTASVNPQTGDYQTSGDVVFVIEQILITYNTFITILDGLQTGNGALTTSYVPSYDNLNALSSLVDYSISQLFNIAITAKQKRSIILEDDSNAILLSHRFYGPSQDDSNINQFMEQNKIGLSELLLLKKGRKIVYYV